MEEMTLAELGMHQYLERIGVYKTWGIKSCSTERPEKQAIDKLASTVITTAASNGFIAKDTLCDIERDEVLSKFNTYVYAFCVRCPS